jgi:hypothetical protein
MNTTNLDDNKTNLDDNKMNVSFDKYINYSNGNEMKLVKKYIYNTMNYKKVIISKKYSDQTIDNELFSVSINTNYDIHTIKITPKIKLQNYNLMNIIIDKNTINLNPILYENDDDTYYFITNGLISSRWLYIIQDFFWKDIIIQDTEKNICLDIIDCIPNIVLYNIMNLTPYYYGRIIIDDDEWIVKDCNIEFEYTKNIINKSKNYKSIESYDYKGNITNAYSDFPASEGGLTFNNKYLNDYTSIQSLYLRKHRSYYAKGSHIFTSKHNNYEDLYCLYLFLKDNGIKVIEFT